jgi:hypothetical protein
MLMIIITTIANHNEEGVMEERDGVDVSRVALIESKPSYVTDRIE